MNTFRNIRKGLMLVDTSSDPNFFRSPPAAEFLDG